MTQRRSIRGILSLLLAVATWPALGQNSTAVLWPQAQWETATPEQVGMDSSLLAKARDYALTGGGSGMITRHGKVVLRVGRSEADLRPEVLHEGHRRHRRRPGPDGRQVRESARAGLEVPSAVGRPAGDEQGQGLDKITLFHLATQTAGFDKNGGYTELLFEPGTKWSYSDGGPNWLAECVTLAYGRDLQELMFERVFTPIGIARDDLKWRANSYRPKEIDGVTRREFGAGISANVDAMARIGYLYLRGGQWRDRQIIPAWFVEAVRTVPYGIKGCRWSSRRATATPRITTACCGGTTPTGR